MSDTPKPRTWALSEGADRNQMVRELLELKAERDAAVERAENTEAAFGLMVKRAKTAEAERDAVVERYRETESHLMERESAAVEKMERAEAERDRYKAALDEAVRPGTIEDFLASLSPED